MVHPAPSAPRLASSTRRHQPDARRPLRIKRLQLLAAAVVLPHQHPWAQVAVSNAGAVRVTVADGTYLVPPSRALWIPPGVQHAVTAVEAAELVTLYLHQPDGRCGPGVSPAAEAPWRECRVLEVSDLLRALLLQMDATPDNPDQPPLAALLQREKLIGALVQDELRRARALRLGVALPRDKRLRTLCEAVLDEPARHRTLAGWAQHAGASPRTLARLFRDELGVSFGQWRQQVFLSRALALAEHGTPMAQIAGELGYASASAFTAMVRRTVGQAPRRFFAAAG